MTSESFAETLFFTRAAVEADPALANARIDAPLGRVSVHGRPDRPDDPPLAIVGLYRVWDDHAVQSPCPRCGAPRLFLDASGGGMHRPVAFVHHLCPFCRETNHGHESPWANFRVVRRRPDAAGETVRRRARNDRAGGPEPLPRRSPRPCRIVPADAVRVPDSPRLPGRPPDRHRILTAQSEIDPHAERALRRTGARAVDNFLRFR